MTSTRQEPDGLVFEGSVRSRAPASADGGLGSGVQDLRWNPETGAIDALLLGAWVEKIPFVAFDA